MKLRSAVSSALRFSLQWLLLVTAALILAGCAAHPQPKWQLDNVAGHLPDLKFHMTDGLGHHVTAADYRGKVVLLYFGYTHCPDVCPLTMAHLHAVLQKLGPAKAGDVKVLFVTVDLARDTLPVLHHYVRAFDPRFIGLRGTPEELEKLAKRYAVLYKIEKPIPPNGDYAMTHTAAIYIFGPKGHARLMASQGMTVDQIAHDVGILTRQST